MEPTWGPSGADRTQVGPMLAPMNFAILESYQFNPEVTYPIGRMVSYNHWDQDELSPDLEYKDHHSR